MNLTLTAGHGRNGWDVVVTDPTDAVVAMARRMQSAASNQQDAYLLDDGSVELEARGAAGRKLAAWARRVMAETKQDAALASTPAPAMAAYHKPDVSRGSGRCDCCSRPARWVSGAGRYLCPTHQDDY